jgi:hypothetical protein
MKDKSKVTELIPKGSSNDVSKDFKILLGGEMALVKRVFIGIKSQISTVDIKTLNRATLDKFQFIGYELVDINTNDKSLKEFEKAIGKKLIMHQHSEVTMLKTLYRDDMLLCGPIARRKLANQEGSPLDKHIISVYGLTPAISIGAAIVTDHDLETLSSMFML